MEKVSYTQLQKLAEKYSLSVMARSAYLITDQVHIDGEYKLSAEDSMEGECTIVKEGDGYWLENRFGELLRAFESADALRQYLTYHLLVIPVP